METWRGLKDLQTRHKNLVLSVHTVVSRFNIDRIREIVEGLQFLEPDCYITEVAEERVELGTVGWDITPSAAQYAPVAGYLSARAREAARSAGLARFTQALRAYYYQLASADPGEADPGHPLPGRLGERPHCPQRRRLVLLRPRRAGRQFARDRLRFEAHLGRQGGPHAPPAREHLPPGSVPAPWPTPVMPTCCFTCPPSPASRVTC